MDSAMVRTGGRFANPPNSGDSNWIPSSVADYGQGTSAPAGVPDIVWENSGSGRLVIWWMDAGGNRVDGQFLSDGVAGLPLPSVVGPR